MGWCFLISMYTCAPLIGNIVVAKQYMYVPLVGLFVPFCVDESVCVFWLIRLCDVFNRGTGPRAHVQSITITTQQYLSSHRSEVTL